VRSKTEWETNQCWTRSCIKLSNSLHGAAFEKLTVPKLVTKIPAFYGTLRFITVFLRTPTNPVPSQHLRMIHSKRKSLSLLDGYVRVAEISKIFQAELIQYMYLNLLKTERRPLYLKVQFVPPCKHFSSRL
jgi:hypothetical protein